jgi:hypothetical protein
MDEKMFKKLVEVLNQNYSIFDKRVTDLEDKMTVLANKSYNLMDAVLKKVSKLESSKPAAHT